MWQLIVTFTLGVMFLPVDLKYGIGYKYNSVNEQVIFVCFGCILVNKKSLTSPVCNYYDCKFWCRAWYRCRFHSHFFTFYIIEITFFRILQSWLRHALPESFVVFDCSWALRFYQLRLIMKPLSFPSDYRVKRQCEEMGLCGDRFVFILTKDFCLYQSPLPSVSVWRTCDLMSHLLHEWYAFCMKHTDFI